MIGNILTTLLLLIGLRVDLTTCILICLRPLFCLFIGILFSSAFVISLVIIALIPVIRLAIWIVSCSSPLPVGGYSALLQTWLVVNFFIFATFSSIIIVVISGFANGFGVFRIDRFTIGHVTPVLSQVLIFILIFLRLFCDIRSIPCLSST